MSYVVDSKRLEQLTTTIKAYILRFQENLTTWSLLPAESPSLLQFIQDLLNAGQAANSLSELEAWQITQVWLQGGDWTGHGKGYDQRQFWVWHRIPAGAEHDWPRLETAMLELGKEYALSQQNPRQTVIKKVKTRVRGLENPL